MKSVIRLVVAGVFLGAVTPLSLWAAEISRERVRAAVGKSVPLLQQSPLIFFRKAGCVSCHHQSLPGDERRVGACGGIRRR